MMTAHAALAAIWDHVRYRMENPLPTAEQLVAFHDVSNALWVLRRSTAPSMDDIIEEIELRGGW